jgi:serine/threonine-protein kinase
VLWQLSSAVDHLHAQGIVHSDIKPSNIMLNVHDQRATLIDFGVAFELESERKQRGSSGTRGYMAPEQLRGKGCGPATDRYALAAVAQELLGFQPAPATKLEPRRRIARPMSRALPKAREATRSRQAALAAVFRRALHPKPSARYASARNFVSALVRAFNIDSIDPSPNEREVARPQAAHELVPPAPIATAVRTLVARSS